jgi:hypothetical protein
MPQEFKAIVSHARDASTYKEIQEHDRIERPPVRTLKGAEFTILSQGPCPWPPGDIIGKKVRVILED